MEVLGKIRRLYYRDGLSLSEIARKTGYARNTVKRWLKAPEGVKPTYRRPAAGDTKIAPYAAQLVKALEVDALRPKRDRRTALKLFTEIQVAGFTGDYSRVTEFVRRWLTQGGQAKVNAFIPLKFELGEAFQFDWSEEHLLIGGVWRKVLAAHLKLCAGRAFVVSAYPTQGHEMLFDAHTTIHNGADSFTGKVVINSCSCANPMARSGQGAASTGTPGSGTAQLASRK